MIEKPKTIGNQISELFPKGIYSYSEVNGELVLKNEKERIISYITTLEQDYFKLGYADASSVFEKIRTELEMKATGQYRQALADAIEKIKEVTAGNKIIEIKSVESIMTNMLYGSKEKES